MRFQDVTRTVSTYIGKVVLRQFSFVELVRLVLHLSKEDSNYAVQILKHKLWDDLEDVFNDADELIGVKF